MKTFKTWRSIELGTKSKLKDIYISDYAKDMLKKVKYGKKRKIDLVKVTVGELGFDDWTTTKEVFAKAKKLGLELCPQEVGPILRDVYRDQPKDEWLYIGMKMVLDRVGGPSVFELLHGDYGLWLYGFWAGPVYRWSPDVEFLFSLRQSLKLTAKRPLDPLPSSLKTLEKRVSKIEKRLMKLGRI